MVGHKHLMNSKPLKTKKNYQNRAVRNPRTRVPPDSRRCTPLAGDLGHAVPSVASSSARQAHGQPGAAESLQTMTELRWGLRAVQSARWQHGRLRQTAGAGAQWCGEEARAPMVACGRLERCLHRPRLPTSPPTPELLPADDRAPFRTSLNEEMKRKPKFPAFHDDNIIDPELADYMWGDAAVQGSIF